MEKAGTASVDLYGSITVHGDDRTQGVTENSLVIDHFILFAQILRKKFLRLAQPVKTGGIHVKISDIIQYAQIIPVMVTVERHQYLSAVGVSTADDFPYLRLIGQTAAAEIYLSGECLEEYLN